MIGETVPSGFRCRHRRNTYTGCGNSTRKKPGAAMAATLGYVAALAWRPRGIGAVRAHGTRCLVNHQDTKDTKGASVRAALESAGRRLRVPMASVSYGASRKKNLVSWWLANLAGRG
jgi:hypothetical protein